jgi:hypothetical protein
MFKTIAFLVTLTAATTFAGELSPKDVVAQLYKAYGTEQTSGGETRLAGMLVWSTVGKQRVYYQITEGATHEESLEADRHGYQVATNAKISKAWMANKPINANSASRTVPTLAWSRCWKSAGPGDQVATIVAGGKLALPKIAERNALSC